MKSALAIFAKTPRPGSVKTRLTPPLTSEECADLYRCMLLDIVAAAAALPWDLVICYEGDQSFFKAIAPGAVLLPQAGGGLGERLTVAFEALHYLGYQAAVVIGSDAPDLPSSFIEEGVDRLSRGADVVFGPADDGGYYLVGMKGVDTEIFRDIPWSSAAVLAASLERATAAGLRAELLPPWYDVDCYADLSRGSLLECEGAPLTRDFIVRRGIGRLQSA